MKKLYLAFACLFICCFIYGQSPGLVTLEGKQFKLNGNNFYPRVINYEVEISSPAPSNTTWQSDGYITPFVAYGDNGGTASEFYECADKTTCDIQLQNDFNYIAGMGFNTIRVAAFFPRYRSGQLIWQGRNYPAQPNNNWFTIPLDPNNASDAGMQFVLDMYENLLTVAENTTNAVTLAPQPLKVILILIGQNGPFDSPEVTAYNDFLRELSIFIAASPHKNTVLAYDLWNEPCYEDEGPKTKEETCTIIKDWYNTAKSNDPDHLITLGSCGVGDVAKYDPAVIKLDFISLHTYPSFKSFEDRTDPYYQDLALKRVYNDLYWINEVSPYPWIIGETGFTASNFHSVIAEGLYGIVADQDIFAQQTLEATCNCGGSGYSWWAYQDTHWPNPNFPGGEFFGLLERDYVPSGAAEKDAVNTFRNYVPMVTGACPVDYSPSYDHDKLYYNPFKHPYTNALKYTGNITDQDGNPIKDAVIGGHSNLGFDPLLQKDIEEFDLTFTAEDGYFELIPYDYVGAVNDPGEVFSIDFSAPGAERKKYVSTAYPWWCKNNCNTLPAPGNFNIILNRNKVTYNNTLTNITVATGSAHRKLQGVNTLLIKDIIIQTNATADIVAQQEVYLTAGFDAHSGSEVHVFCEPVTMDCGDYSNYQMQYRRGRSSLTQINTNEIKNIEINFKHTDGNRLTITPNPTNGKFTLSLANDNETIGDVVVYDLVGNVIELNNPETYSLHIDLSNEPKGIYILKANTETHSFIKKIIVQ